MRKIKENILKEEELLYQFIGKKIKEFRQGSNLNQTDLAKILQLSRTSIVNIEQGRQKPTLFLLWNVAKCLRKELREFFPNNENNSDFNNTYEELDKCLLNFIETLKAK